VPAVASRRHRLLALTACTLVGLGLVPTTAGAARARAADPPAPTDASAADPGASTAPSADDAVVTTAAFPGGIVRVDGHGWGHGRGLSQWGALGYAIDDGWTYSQILDHYYGGTTAGTVDPNATVYVRLQSHDDESTVVFQTQSLMRTNADGYANPHQALRADLRPDGTYDVFYAGLPPGGESGLDEACAGGGNGVVWAPLANAVAGPINFSSQAPGTEDRTQMLQVCRFDDGNVRYYRGDIQAVRSGVMATTRNIVGLDAEIRGVVPRESPASWGSLDGGEGMHALRAQAVAARSYSAAERRGYWTDFAGAQTCDTTSCQVYMGVGEWRAGGWTPLESANTDAAVAQTPGEVRLWPDGALALTEFSSSTGGHSAPGSPRVVNGTTYRFPAVPDLGDDVCRAGSVCNPRHNWRADIPVADVQAAYPQIGTLQTIDVTQRNGFGDFGGRVEQVVLRGSTGSVTLTGDQFRAKFTLNGVFSRWFSISVGATYAGGTVNPQATGYWLVSPQGEVLTFGAAQRYGDLAGVALNRPIVGIESTASGNGYWLVASDGGIFAFGDATFYGSTGAIRLNQPIVGMSRTPTGRGYWLVASDGGIFSYGDATFYGSTGNIRLNRPVVGMEPTAAGYWLVASDGGIFSYGDAVFRGSTGAITLNRPVTGMSATPGGLGYTLIASDGGTFNFGNATFLGSLPGISVAATAVALSHTASGLGYYVFTNTGGVYPFGDAPAIASTAGTGG
jgi:SpoIID/LytB domain protein